MERLNSKIYRGLVYHERFHPTPHRFSYPATFFAFDPKELQTLAKEFLLFSHNRFGPISFSDADYLDGEADSIATQLEKYLSTLQTGERNLIVTCPRFMGMAFNPVNFHLRLKDHTLSSAVAEVNNTFRDRHLYPLLEFENTAPEKWHARCPKQFHVSPFNNMEGEYHFNFSISSDRLKLGVDLHREGQCIMQTALEGTAHPINSANLWKFFLLHPADTALNSFPRILWQAAVLTYRKRMQIYSRPVPNHSNTILRNEDRVRPPKV